MWFHSPLCPKERGTEKMSSLKKRIECRLTHQIKGSMKPVFYPSVLGETGERGKERRQWDVFLTAFCWLKSWGRNYIRKLTKEGTVTTFLFATKVVDSFVEILSLFPVHPPNQLFSEVDSFMCLRGELLPGKSHILCFGGMGVRGGLFPEII